MAIISWMTGVPTRHQTVTQAEDQGHSLASRSTDRCHLLRLHCQHHPWAILKLKWHHAVSGALKQHRWHLSSLEFHERLDGEHPECSNLVTQDTGWDRGTRSAMQPQYRWSVKHLQWVGSPSWRRSFWAKAFQALRLGAESLKHPGPFTPGCGWESPKMLSVNIISQCKGKSWREQSCFRFRGKNCKADVLSL